MSRCLHHNTLGCIAQCPGQCCLHLYFGNVGLRLLPHELQQWRGIVAERCAYHAVSVVDATARCLSLPGPVANQVFLFSLEELFLLHDLLVSAALILEVESILAQPSNWQSGAQ
ncbi:hypothetical protein GO988_02115 [Hymenobacter sp. HMF4947]|uniref:Uncharacterized protein n=1 Tax=Hymenobacter ginkgonis TaxID=2682976 RepID=A0A7K1T9M7_9BACT|nr:hypothetical protein [Hymenobacter ginkgonis]MVN75114.1 hypothetical protein [Hymenobacter ginkgonis]